MIVNKAYTSDIMYTVHCVCVCMYVKYHICTVYVWAICVLGYGSTCNTVHPLVYLCHYGLFYVHLCSMLVDRNVYSMSCIFRLLCVYVFTVCIMCVGTNYVHTGGGDCVENLSVRVYGYVDACMCVWYVHHACTVYVRMHVCVCAPVFRITSYC